ncbi:MAG TPA: hypothetical protein VLE72_02375 [Candidatus Saccharimonadales bacterium]|nr:hypothetical protein [Candidatus Saccharimonadales bacterium]
MAEAIFIKLRGSTDVVEEGRERIQAILEYQFRTAPLRFAIDRELGVLVTEAAGNEAPDDSRQWVDIHDMSEWDFPVSHARQLSEVIDTWLKDLSDSQRKDLCRAQPFEVHGLQLIGFQARTRRIGETRVLAFVPAWV